MPQMPLTTNDDFYHIILMATIICKIWKWDKLDALKASPFTSLDLSLTLELVVIVGWSSDWGQLPKLSNWGWLPKLSDQGQLWKFSSQDQLHKYLSSWAYCVNQGQQWPCRTHKWLPERLKCYFRDDLHVGVGMYNTLHKFFSMKCPRAKSCIVPISEHTLISFA